MLEKKDDKKSKEGMNNGEPIERGTDMSTREEEEGEYRRNLASLLDKKTNGHFVSSTACENFFNHSKLSVL